MTKWDKSLSVCHVVSGDLWAGAEVQVFHLLSELQKKDILHLSVILFNEGDLAERLRNAHIRVVVFDETKQNIYQLIIKARRFFKREQVEVIHSHRYKENIIAALASRWLQGSPRLVQTIHGLPHPRRGVKGAKMRIYGGADALFRRFFADRAVAVSEELNQTLSKGELSSKFRCIPNGIPVALPKLPVNAKLSSSTKTIAVVSRLVPVKNIQVCIRAIPKMLNYRSDLRFLVIGDGPEKDFLQMLANELGVEQHVEFTGHIRDMDSIWPKIDIYVLCSRHEGLSIALLEAMAHGVLVIATAVGGNTEVIQNRGNGILIPTESPVAIAESCLELLKAPADQLRSMQLSAINTVAECYSSTTCAENYLRLYHDIIP